MRKRTLCCLQLLSTVGGSEGGHVTRTLRAHTAHEQHIWIMVQKVRWRELLLEITGDALYYSVCFKKAYIYILVYWIKHTCGLYIDDGVVPLKLECNLCCHRPLLVTTRSLLGTCNAVIPCCMREDIKRSHHVSQHLLKKTFLYVSQLCILPFRLSFACWCGLHVLM